MVFEILQDKIYFETDSDRDKKLQNVSRRNADIHSIDKFISAIAQEHEHKITLKFMCFVNSIFINRSESNTERNDAGLQEFTEVHVQCRYPSATWLCTS